MQNTPITLPGHARILVVKLAGIGDLLLATPALRALRESYPEAQIDLLVTPDSAGLLNGWNVINDIIVLDKYLFDKPKQIVKNPQALGRLRELWQRLRAGKYDAVLLLHHLTLPFGRLKHHMLMRATGAKWRVGLDNGHGWFLNLRVKDDGFGALHEAEYNMAIATMIGATVRDKKLYFPIGEQERNKAHEILSQADMLPHGAHPLIAIHPGSGGYSVARRWAPERFAHLIDTLHQDCAARFIIIGGSEEAELHQQIMSMLQSPAEVKSLAGQGSIKVAGAILEQVDLFVGNDAGPMHIAAAVGTPSVAIFSLSNHKAWGPYTGEEGRNKRAAIVRLDLPCMPCFYTGHLLGTPEGCATRDCINKLEVDPVAIAARRLLKEHFYYEQQKQS